MPIAGPTGTEMLLGQNPVPAAPGAAPGTPPNLNALNGGYLLPQNTEPAAPGDGAVAGVTPGQENADLGRLDYLRRLHGMYREGNLKGALLGRVPKEQLSEPFPGTAPPPGTALPPGLGGPPAASVPPPPTPAEVPPGPQAPPPPLRTTHMNRETFTVMAGTAALSVAVVLGAANATAQPSAPITNAPASPSSSTTTSSSTSSSTGGSHGRRQLQRRVRDQPRRTGRARAEPQRATAARAPASTPRQDRAPAERPPATAVRARESTPQARWADRPERSMLEAGIGYRRQR